MKNEAIPILDRHDHARVLGKAYMENCKLVVEFVAPVPYDEVCRMLPGCAFMVSRGSAKGMEWKTIERMEIVELSLGVIP